MANDRPFPTISAGLSSMFILEFENLSSPTWLSHILSSSIGRMLQLICRHWFVQLQSLRSTNLLWQSYPRKNPDGETKRPRELTAFATENQWNNRMNSSSREGRESWFQYVMFLNFECALQWFVSPLEMLLFLFFSRTNPAETWNDPQDEMALHDN